MHVFKIVVNSQWLVVYDISHVSKFGFLVAKDLLSVQHREGLTGVQALFRQHQKSSSNMMTIVDHLKHLCIDQYFQDEIGNVVDSCMDLTHSDNLLDVTLSMRLMREAGYHVSAGQQNIILYIFYRIV